MLTKSAYEIVEENKLRGRDDSSLSIGIINRIKEIRAADKIDSQRRKKMREDLYKKNNPNSEQKTGLEVINKFLDRYFPKTLVERFENTKEDFMKKFTPEGQNDNIKRHNLKYGTNIPYMKSKFDMRVEPELERMRDEEGSGNVNLNNRAEDGWVATERGQQWIAARTKKQKDSQVLGSEKSSRDSIERFLGIFKNDFANPVEAIPDSALEELNTVLPFFNADSLGINILPYTAEEEAEDNNEFPNPAITLEDDFRIIDMIDKDKRKVKIGDNISF